MGEATESQTAQASPEPVLAEGGRTGWSRHAVAVLVFVVLTIALTWPMARHLGTKIPIHKNYTILVPYYHEYLIAWYHHVFDRGLSGFWDMNIFYPHPRVLTYFESLPAPAAMTWPAHLATENATLSYNLVAWGAFVLNGVGTYVLALELGLAWPLALLSGGLLAFCPYMFGEIYCLAMLNLYPAPFLLAAIHRWTRRPTWGGVVLAGLCGLWLVASCYQYTLFLSIFCVAWVLWLARRLDWRRLWYKLLIVGAISGTVAWVPLSTVRQTHREMGFYHGPTLPTDWMRLLAPPTQNRLYRDVLGITIRETRGGHDPVVCWPGLTFSFLAAVGAYAALFGRMASEEERKRRHVFRYLLIASVAAVAFSFGLWIHVGPIRVPGPYGLLFLALGPFSSVRSVYRFFIIGQLFAAILAALGLGWLLRSISKPVARGTVWSAVLLLILAESIWIPLRLEPVGGRPQDVHPNYRYVHETDPNAPMIELPVPNDIKRGPLDALYTLASMHTWQPLVNGYASYYPGLYEELRPVAAGFPSYESLRYFRALGVRFLHVRGGLMPRGWEKGVRRLTALREVHRHGGAVLYELRKSRRVFLGDLEGETSFAVVRIEGNRTQAKGAVALPLGIQQVIPVLPGDRGTRWTVRWTDASGEEVLVENVDVRDSHWLTDEDNALTATLRLPQAPGTYDVKAFDRSSGNALGTARIQLE